MRASDDEVGEIVLAARAGDRAAFSRLVEHFGPDLHAWASVRLLPERGIELEPLDLVQEVWFRAFRALERYDHERSAFRLWLFRIAKNVLLELFQKVRRPDRVRQGGSTSRMHVIESVPDEATAISRRLARDESVAALVERLQGLKPDDRRLVVHYVLEGMPLGDVAERLDLTRAAVTKRWQRLRASLQR